MEAKQTIDLAIDGLGLILYSPFAVAHIPEKEDYFSEHHMYADQVVEHTNRGTIVDVATGTPGRFSLRVFHGKPPSHDLDSADKVLHLGVEVRDRQLHVRDVNDLMYWTKDVPQEQVIELDDGFYELIATTRRPASGIWGDHQVANLWFIKADALPELSFEDIPELFG